MYDGLCFVCVIYVSVCGIYSICMLFVLYGHEVCVSLHMVWCVCVVWLPMQVWCVLLEIILSGGMLIYSVA